MVVHARCRADGLFVLHRVGGHGDDREFVKPAPAANFACRGKAVHDRHLDVHQYQIEGVRAGFPQDVERFLAVGSGARGDADDGQQRFDDFAVERLVIHHQYLHIPVAHRQHGLVGGVCGLRQIDGSAQPQPDPDAEGGADALLAGDADIAAHHFCQTPGQRQPEAGAAELAAHGDIGLGEGLEQAGEAFLGETDTRIFDVDPQADAICLTGLQADAHLDPAGGGELDGIGQQVEQDLLDAQGVAEEYIRYSGVNLFNQFQALFFCPVRHHRAATLNQAMQAEAGGFKLHVAGGYLRQIEQVVDDAGEASTGAGDLVQIVLLFRVGADASREFRQADHRVERRAQFVADVGEEGVLRLIGDLGRLQCVHKICGAGFNQDLQMRPMLFEFIFDALALGDVFLDRQIVGGPSCIIDDRRDRGFFPEKFAVLAPVAHDAVPLLAREQGLPEFSIDLGRRFARLEDARILADGFVRGIAADFGKPRVDVLDQAGGTGDDDGGRALLDRLQQFLRFLLGVVAFRNVCVDPDTAFMGMLGIKGAAVQCPVEQAAVLVLQDQFGAVVPVLGHHPVGLVADFVE